MFNLIIEASLDNSPCAFLPFGHLVIEFLAIHLIALEPHETRLPTGKPISRMTLRMSNTHLGVTPPPPPQLAPHTMELDSPKEVVSPLTATNIPSTSTVPPSTAPAASDPKIADAIATLFVHMDVIHKDLIEHIGLVHERVDLIVERREHDIKAVHDTLLVLYECHSGFIIEVNDFINNIRRH
ncbi:hypothetical protein Acr_00g0030640 [Actinidia rufa]|uniref:Uncharacterized protein n=1 Tax=Actinidia rufa TaxID=165716 RepID=A0A7J0DEY1_9ERIC|nr:hypothetical protein Acr_00g0030640 [Actinidia rufa]